MRVLILGWRSFGVKSLQLSDISKSGYWWFSSKLQNLFACVDNIRKKLVIKQAEINVLFKLKLCNVFPNRVTVDSRYLELSLRKGNEKQFEIAKSSRQAIVNDLKTKARGMGLSSRQRGFRDIYSGSLLYSKMSFRKLQYLVCSRHVCAPALYNIINIISFHFTLDTTSNLLSRM